jgi:uncharacterized protein YndB with AHSA1/START domain
MSKASIQITPDQDAIVAEIEIAAPPERVFQALTDPAQLMLWFVATPKGRFGRWTRVRVANGDTN